MSITRAAVLVTAAIGTLALPAAAGAAAATTPMQAKVARLEKTVAKLTKTVKTLQTQLKTYSNVNATLSTQVGALQTSFTAAQTDITALKAKSACLVSATAVNAWSNFVFHDAPSNGLFEGSGLALSTPTDAPTAYVAGIDGSCVGPVLPRWPTTAVSDVVRAGN
jgi:Tfp pilus assembly protein FimV